MKLTVIAAPLLIVVALSPFALGQTADSRSTSAGPEAEESYRLPQADSNRTDVSDPMFAKGGAFRDVYARSEWLLRRGLSLSSFLQYEWWNFPLLTSGRKRNDVTASFQLTYWPHWRVSSKD